MLVCLVSQGARAEQGHAVLVRLVSRRSIGALGGTGAGQGGALSAALDALLPAPAPPHPEAR